MTDHALAGTPGAPLQSLADRLSRLAPPAAAATLASPPRPSPAVAAALAQTQKLAALAAARSRRNRSLIVAAVESFVSACSFIPYAVVALALRLVMAREFFLQGQALVDGPRVPLTVGDFSLSAVLPLQIKAETFGLFLSKYAALPVPPAIGAYALSYALFVLPIMLVLGFGTRFAALALLAFTALLQVYVAPEALWTTHIYWAAILLVLFGGGPGQVSVDFIIRYLVRR